jgi:hypothetical protein
MGDSLTKRAEDRKKVTSCYAEYRLLGAKKKLWGLIKSPPKRGLVVNISKAGAGMRTIEVIEPEAMLDLTLLLHGVKKPVCVKGKVQWVREERKLGTVTYTHIVGLQFVEYSPEAWQALLKFVGE